MCEGTLSIEVVILLWNFNKLLLSLFIIISKIVNLNSQCYPGHHLHQSHVEPNVPPLHISEYMPQHHQSHAQSIYQSIGFSGYIPQGCEQSFQPLGFSSYMPQYSFQVPSTSNIFSSYVLYISLLRKNPHQVNYFES